MGRKSLEFEKNESFILLERMLKKWQKLLEAQDLFFCTAWEIIALASITTVW